MSSPIPEPAHTCTTPWKIHPSPIRLLGGSRRGKEYLHEVIVSIAVRRHEAPHEWTSFAAPILDQTLWLLLGPGAAVRPLLESALSEAAMSWPPALADEPLSVWLQRIATSVAIRHLRATPGASNDDRPERPGGVRQLLASVYASLVKLPPEDRVAFALVELGGRSPVEAAAVLGVPFHIVEQRARRAGRHLLFAARRDALLLSYLRLAARWRALSRRPDQKALASLCRGGTSGIHADLAAEIRWFVQPSTDPSERRSSPGASRVLDAPEDALAAAPRVTAGAMGSSPARSIAPVSPPAGASIVPAL